MTNEEVMELLNEDEYEFFKTLAPSYQKNFIFHVTSAKTEKTRLNRIEEFKEAMQLNCKNVFEYKKKINPPKHIKEQLSDEENIELYFAKVLDDDKRKMVRNLYDCILKDFSELSAKYAWNQPMIYLNKTFIMNIAPAKNHFSIAIEKTPLAFFSDEIKACDYELLKKGFKINYNQDINYELIKKIIIFSIDFKKDYETVFEK